MSVSTLEKLSKKYDLNLKRILLNPWFLGILALKIVVGSLVASSYMWDGFIPFISYYVTSGLDNPYGYFADIGQTAAFPYPPVMLWILASIRWLASPFLSGDWSVVTWGHLLVTRLPILLADVTLYIVLTKWLETKEKHVLLLYWASPILFFINYIHGQLDVIPMALLFVSLLFVFYRRIGAAMLFLGLGIAAKTHLLVILPFFGIYFLVNRFGWTRALSYLSLAGVVFLGLVSPFLMVPGFATSVFGTDEAAKVFLVHVPYLQEDLRLLIAPAALAILFFNFFSYKKINQDAFLLILALVFSIFVIFVPPMPGWLYWSIPFYVYFFAKYKDIPRLSFWFLNISYVLYVILSKDSTITTIFQVVWPEMNMALPYQMLLDAGYNAPLIVNSVFTLLIASLVMNAVWIYRTGVRSNLEYAENENGLAIGIGGDSGAGKNTLAHLLELVFGKHNTTLLEGDDAHRWERGDERWKTTTHLNPKGNDLHADLNQAKALRSGRDIQRKLYDHDTGRFTEPKHLQSNQVSVYVGLHPFYLREMRELLDIKVYIDPSEKVRRFWKVRRDMKKRGKTEEEVLKQMSDREGDAQKYIHPQRQFADIIFRAEAVKELVNGDENEMQWKCTLDNSFNCDPLLNLLADLDALVVNHEFEDDLHRQTIKMRNTASVQAEQINEIAYELIPNLDELTSHSPEWKDGVSGLQQLLVVYYYSEQQRNQTS